MESMDLQSFDKQYGDLGSDVIGKMSESNAEVYQGLRDQENKDSIEKSNQSTDANNLSGLVSVGAVPLLIPPNYSADFDGRKDNKVGSAEAGSTASSSQAWFTENQKSFMEGLTRRVLDGMVEAAAKSVDQSKENSKQLDAKALREHFELMIDQTRGPGSPGFLDPNTVSGAAVLMAGLTGVMASGKIDASDPFQRGISAIQNSIGAATPMVPSDMRAELGYIGALLACPASFQALAMTVGKGEKGGEVNQQFAQNYADRLMALISDKNFNSYVQTVIQAKAPGDAPLTENQMKEYEAAFKLGLLVSAYALMYKAETGGVTGDEVFAEVDKLAPGQEGDKQSLGRAIKDLMAQLKEISPERLDQVRNNLADFISSNTSVKSLADPLNVFQVATSGKDIQQGNATRTAA
ncbi:MAG: hypothetical protein Q8K75_04545 [Chlamydiales bacterium]|nr:hypothetical protein [Chlamydiales bacterium]